MNNYLEYRGEFTRMILYLISTNGLISIVCFLSSSKINVTLILLGTVNVLYLASIINKPLKIIIHRDKLLLEVHYPFNLLKKRKIVALHEVNYSFNYEVQARGGKVKVLKIMHENSLIAELMPDYNGWDKKKLDQFFETLNNLKEFN